MIRLSKKFPQFAKVVSYLRESEENEMIGYWLSSATPEFDMPASISDSLLTSSDKYINEFVSFFLIFIWKSITYIFECSLTCIESS